MAMAMLLPGAGNVVAGDPAPLTGTVRTNQVWVTNVVTVTVTVTNYVTITNVVTDGTAYASGLMEQASDSASWAPPDDGFDWIELKSGEWLKGRIRALQDRKLDFDSEELDELTLDWGDVRRVRSAQFLDVLFSGGQRRSGLVTITPQHVEVEGTVPPEMPRNELLGLTPGGKNERSRWSGKASVGLTLRSGNTEQIDYNAQARLQRRTPATRLSLDYIGNTSKTSGQETANNHRVNSEFDRWLSQRLYLLIPFVEYYRDPFQNIAHRGTLGVGVGYDLVDRPNLEWNVTTGPAYQHVWFDSVQPGQSDQNGTGALVFGTRFDWDITRHIELILEYRGQYTSQKAGETAHHTVGTVSFELTKRLDLDVSLVWDRISQPKPDASGATRKPDDFRLVFGLGLDF
jgi:YD repeat-containing protein